VYAIADSLNKPYSTIRDRPGRAVNDGLGGIYDETRPGASCRLTPEQFKCNRCNRLSRMKEFVKNESS